MLVSGFISTAAAEPEKYYICAFKWGLNLDLGYCGWMSGNDLDERYVKIVIDNVTPPSEYQLGRANVCSDQKDLSNLSRGMRIEVPATCLMNKFSVTNWGLRKDSGYEAYIQPGSFTGTSIGLLIDTVAEPRFGGAATECSGNHELSDLHGRDIIVPSRCISDDLSSELSRYTLEIVERAAFRAIVAH